MSNPNPLPGPGRPAGRVVLAEWKQFLTRQEWLRVRAIEHKLNEPGPRVMGKQSAMYDVGRAALVHELGILRNRGVKRKAVAERWGSQR